MKSDTYNLILAESPEAVDAANRDFYATFPYPWSPMSFPRLDDPDFERVMLNQSIGDFSHCRQWGAPWTMEFSIADLQQRFDLLPDVAG